MALPGAFCGTTPSVPALMGAIMSVGVATADAGAAALAAGATRLRPVLMTALAMIIGMLPMSLGLGEGGEQNAPLGRAVIGGLAVATFATLFLVPVLYSLLRRRAPRARTSSARPRRTRRSRVMPRTRTTWAALAGLAILAGLLVTRFVPRMRKDTELVDLNLPSSIQASEETAIYARSSGYVRERYVDVGDRVAAGKVLAQIDTPELDQELVQARATLQQARASPDQARANETFAGATADRFTRLEQGGFVAHQDADEKRTGLASATATTAAAQANVDAMQANIAALEASVEAARPRPLNRPR
jgi:multidrug efflux pump subunit AcrA (membrane-fusion protein)